MSANMELVRKEQALEQLLPGAGAQSDRPQLLAALSAYAVACVEEAQRRGARVPDAEELARARAWLLRPVFLCGHHRSGTTLLHGLLDGHPELLVLPSEGTYFTSFRHVTVNDPPARSLEKFIAEWIARCVDPNFEPHFRLGRSDASRQPSVDLARHFFGWHAALRAEAPKPFAPLLALVAAFRCVIGAPEPRGWAEKTPLNEQHVRQLEAFESARYIQAVRHPVATLASLRELYRESPAGRFDANTHARAIARSLRLARAHQQDLAGRYLVVRYEDLANETLSEMERVRTFLGLSPNELLHAPTAGGSPLRSNSSFTRGDAGVVNRARAPGSVAGADAAALGVFAAGAARVFGYDIPPARPATALGVRLRSLPRLALGWLRGVPH